MEILQYGYFYNFLTALLPIALLVYYIYHKDKKSPEPTGQLVKAFLFGILSTAMTGTILPQNKGHFTMQRNANIEQTSEINKDFFVISQRVKQIFAVYCKYAKNSKKKCVFCRFYWFLCKKAVPCLFPE